MKLTGTKAEKKLMYYVLRKAEANINGRDKIDARDKEAKTLINKLFDDLSCIN